MEGLESLTSKEALAAGGILGAGLTMYMMFILVWYIFQIIARWKIFVKAGEAGWKAIIPIYNEYVQIKFSWKTSMFWVIFLLSIVLGVTSVLLEGLSDTSAVIVDLIQIIASIVVLILYIKEYIYLAKAFGKGTGFTVGLVLLTPIFMLILGFGSAEYVGNKYNEQQ